ncbi:hypothetical protein NB640_07020 [Oxalobacter vibrioformis]|uniref:YqjK-like protein n=1 Tax=Oxalobacter vibrioformis TaxID=933080 RepID=A0A9E9LWS1_9BURK|nr:hypothetical protein [Oxalobacter vibrioformis]NLC24961.1 hypothetical protein [Oxalobacter sp.]WAW09040.1 hypothetical protein NB640_07020 [Oxalobacter vibrioformis]
MTERPKSLAKRREELVTKSAIQREQMAAILQDTWQPGALSTGKNILSQARQKPLLSGFLATLVFLFFRKNRLFSLLAAGIVTFKTWARYSPFVMPYLRKLWQHYQKRRLSQ